MACPVAPCVNVRLGGVRARVKSFGCAGAAFTVSLRLAVWVNEPEVPVRVTFAFPVAALAAAVTVVFCAVPGVRFSVDGLAVTPDGRPLKLTFTDPLNPFVGVAFTETT